MLLVCWPAAPALARSSAPDGTPAIDQYVESVPNGGGDSVPGGGADRSASGARLPAPIRKQLARRKQGALLEGLASSPKLGAPASGPSGAKNERGGRRGERGEERSSGEVRSSASKASSADDAARPRLSVVTDSLTSPAGGAVLAAILIIGLSAIAIARRKASR